MIFLRFSFLNICQIWFHFYINTDIHIKKSQGENKMKTTILAIIAIIILLTCTCPIEKSKIIQTDIKEKSLPESFTWQDIEGIDYTTEIKDQSPAPTCEAYALCAALETIMQYQKNETYNPDLSETHLYFYAGGTFDAGYVNLIDAANYLVEHGVPDEGCYPDPQRAYDYPFISLDGWENRTTKISSWDWVNNTETEIKEALIEHGPLVFCAYFWKDFNFYLRGIYKHRWGLLAGGHVMTIVGYDDSEQCWIVKNSWGTNWGLDGWLKMSYDADMITNQWYTQYDENCTGIMYLDGAYGNLEPDVPKVYIDNLNIRKSYVLGNEIRTLFSKSRFFTSTTPRVFGNMEIKVTAENADRVEFYLDGVKSHIDDASPFTWNLEAIRGRHTLTVKAIKGQNASLDIRDFYKII